MQQFLIALKIRKKKNIIAIMIHNLRNYSILVSIKIGQNMDRSNFISNAETHEINLNECMKLLYEN